MAKKDKWFRVRGEFIMTRWIDIKAPSKDKAEAIARTCLGPAWSDTRIVTSKIEATETKKG